MQRKKGCGIPTTKDNVLGLVTEDKEATIGYEELKMLAQERSSWHQ